MIKGKKERKREEGRREGVESYHKATGVRTRSKATEAEPRTKVTSGAEPHCNCCQNPLMIICRLPDHEKAKMPTLIATI